MFLRYVNHTRLNGEKKNKIFTVIERNTIHFNNTPVDYNTTEVSIANRTSFDGHQQSKRNVKAVQYVVPMVLKPNFQFLSQRHNFAIF